MVVHTTVPSVVAPPAVALNIASVVASLWPAVVALATVPATSIATAPNA